ncbi:hypothetical protein GTQ43_38905 [Nostoc sp. KVJ3]|uniref:hypothetical protein n=1 Tax=Nostoc sp. KVJ3 TaxID=457945 RepID=UPI0022373785|nr:hypothetical protein [Nostoc sp. KVJ3]MCW5319329.1 hypothetical protein [Nostoc sp. KVJ3]
MIQLLILRALEEAYKNGWLLSTRELATLLKLSSSTVCRYGSKFEDAGFVFTRAGQRKGGEVAGQLENRENLNNLGVTFL